MIYEFNEACMWQGGEPGRMHEELKSILTSISSVGHITLFKHLSTIRIIAPSIYDSKQQGSQFRDTSFHCVDDQ